jgi:hypothetical protein
LEFDGGLWTQNASWWLLEHPDWFDKITDLISIYVSPDNNIIPERDEPSNIAAAAMGTIDIMQQANYKKEERAERKTCAALGVNLYEVRLPLVTVGKYDTDPKRLKYLQDLGADEMRRTIDKVERK